MLQSGPTAIPTAPEDNGIRVLVAFDIDAAEQPSRILAPPTSNSKAAPDVT